MKSLSYRPDIDGLRAVAVLAVLGFHAFPGLFPGGFVGVDVFFVISGYLITRILLNEADGDGISIRRFYARRVLRIFPALVTVLVSCLFFGWYVLLATEYKQLGQHVLAGATFVSNFELWSEAGYFDKASEAKPLLHLWSLGIEEQFYIFWPLLLLVLRRGTRSLVPWISVLLLASLTYSVWVIHFDRTQAFYSPLPRAWELLAGAMLGYLSQTNHSSLRRMNHPAVPLAGLFAILACVFLLQTTDPFPGFLALVPVLGAALLIGSRPSSWVHIRFLSHPIMRGIGLISYPLYLWHWPLLSFASIVKTGTPSLEMRGALIVISFIMAWLTFWAIEGPIKQLPRKATIGLLIAMVFMLALIGKNISDREGLDFRYRNMIAVDAEVQKDFVDWEKTGLITEASCKMPFQFPGREYCLTKHADRPPTAAVIGDSHALHAYWGIADALDKIGENLIAIGRGACVPLLGYSRGNDEDGCQPHMDAMISFAADDPSIKKVILIFRGRYLPNDSDAKTVSMFENGLDRTLKRLLASGKEVYYFLPVVEPGFDPRLCLGELPLGRKSPMPCDVSRAEDFAHTVMLRKIVNTVLDGYKVVHKIDPNDYLCDSDRCPIVREGHAMFKDENHLSYSGAVFIGRSIPWAKDDKSPVPH